MLYVLCAIQLAIWLHMIKIFYNYSLDYKIWKFRLDRADEYYCMCGETIDSHHWANHAPVSQRDYISLDKPKYK
ncbi:MAG: hypothetical protein COY92_07075 [Shewanella sp. CG_4_10_14_0_8_um_filter_42_13]|nr:MAG: hypothetical protein COY92_07075 [Shewanella sp. CG_4_10_14_0_8_um_filter_42_13]